MKKTNPSVFCFAKASSPFKGAKVKNGSSEKWAGITLRFAPPIVAILHSAFCILHLKKHPKGCFLYLLYHRFISRRYTLVFHIGIAYYKAGNRVMTVGCTKLL